MRTGRRGGQGAGPVQPLHPSGHNAQLWVPWTHRLVSSLQSPGRGREQNRKVILQDSAQRQLSGGWGQEVEGGWALQSSPPSPYFLGLLPTLGGPISSEAGRELP